MSHDEDRVMKALFYLVIIALCCGILGVCYYNAKAKCERKGGEFRFTRDGGLCFRKGILIK